MRIVNAELLVPTAEDIRNFVQTAYDVGLKRGRKEAKHELQSPVAVAPDGASFEAGEAGKRKVAMNGIERRGFVSDCERLMRDDLAELREMMRLSGRIPGDEEKIEMIENLLARRHKIALIMPLIHNDDESQFQTANLNLTRVRARTEPSVALAMQTWHEVAAM